MARIHIALLALPLALLTQACPSGKSKPKTASPETSDDARAGSVNAEPAIAQGVHRFHCSITAAAPQQGDCTIEKLAGGEIQFSMPFAKTGKLLGQLVPTDFGYQFSGHLATASIPKSALTIELFRQGKGSYAAVVPVPGHRPWQLTLTPKE